MLHNILHILENVYICCIYICWHVSGKKFEVIGRQKCPPGLEVEGKRICKLACCVVDLDLENNGDDFKIETPCYQHEDNYCTQTPSQRSKIICHEGT